MCVQGVGRAGQGTGVQPGPGALSAGAGREEVAWGSWGQR